MADNETNNSILIVSIGIYLALGYFFLTSDFFNKRFNPREYWTKRVVGLERLIKFNEAYLENTNFKLQLKQNNLNSIIHYKSLTLRALEIDSTMAEKLATKFVSSEIDSLKDLLASLGEKINSDKKLLKTSNDKLRKHNNKN